MASIDENAQVGIELATSTLRLSGRAIIAIMDMFLEKDDRKEYYQDLNNKQGKQKIKDLFTKYENTGIQSLGDNLSSEERKFFEKELKAMGVDFSIRKVGKDEYSLFFAGKDIEAIEKGMENAISKYGQREQRMDKMKNVFNRNIKNEKSSENNNKERTEINLNKENVNEILDDLEEQKILDKIDVKNIKNAVNKDERYFTLFEDDDSFKIETDYYRSVDPYGNEFEITIDKKNKKANVVETDIASGDSWTMKKNEKVKNADFDVSKLEKISKNKSKSKEKNKKPMFSVDLLKQKDKELQKDRKKKEKVKNKKQNKSL